MSVKQQIKLFRNANFIISLNGAGMVNASFSKPKTIVLELFTGYYMEPSYKIQSITFGHQYNYMIGKTALKDNIPPQKEDVNIDPLKFEEAINIILSK